MVTAMRRARRARCLEVQQAVKEDHIASTCTSPPSPPPPFPAAAAAAAPPASASPSARACC